MKIGSCSKILWKRNCFTLHFSALPFTENTKFYLWSLTQCLLFQWLCGHLVSACNPGVSIIQPLTALSSLLISLSQYTTRPPKCNDTYPFDRDKMCIISYSTTCQSITQSILTQLKIFTLFFWVIIDLPEIFSVLTTNLDLYYKILEVLEVSVSCVYLQRRFLEQCSEYPLLLTHWTVPIEITSIIAY